MLKLKKKVSLILVTALAFVIFSGAVLASSIGIGVVKCSTYLNVRSSNSTSATIIGKLYNGNKITVLASSNGWYNINYGTGTAWVSSNYVALQSSSSIVVQTAQSLVGTKYVFGGATPSGFDCSGYTMYVYSKVGISLKHSAAVQATAGTAVSRSNLRPGDLVFFATDGVTRNVTHCGIYIGNNNVLQAETGSVQKVASISLTNSYWTKAYVSARRILN
jgi:cell wall-associated NlpC family hydrolase